MKKILSCAIATISLLAGLSAISIPLVYARKESSVVYNDVGMNDEVEHINGNYNVNSNGQTYGVGINSVYVEDLPELLSVVGDNGKEGYVYTKEFLKSPSSPEEAIEIQKALEGGYYIPTVLNVYDSDGETVIDTFTETIPDEYK